MDEEQEVEMVRQLFVKMGSEGSQARNMAMQLVKRAGQVSRDRGVGRVEAMQYLIELVTKGRSGASADSFLGEDRGEPDAD